LEENVLGNSITGGKALICLEVVNFHSCYNTFEWIFVRQAAQKYFILAMPRLSSTGQIFGPKIPHALQKQMSFPIESNPKQLGDVW
jgi:hypothetical protein